MSQINFEDETLDASDGVTKLLLAAEYWKAKASALRAKIGEMEQQEIAERVAAGVADLTARLENKDKELLKQAAVVVDLRNKLGEARAAYHELQESPTLESTDPALNGGWKLVPIEPTFEMLDKGSDQSDGYVSVAKAVWDAMLAAAPKQEAKP